LKQIREAIRNAVPDAEEVISYQLPAYKFHGWIFYFGAFKKHYSISCPPPFTVFEAFADELKDYEISKSAVQFPKGKDVPLDLIARMAKFRADENIRLSKRNKKR
jgi:uncharacterized protein YdhG (YjbR/CyaY superfamily)